MLTVAEGRVQEVAKEFGKNVSIHLYGQENSDETYAIARSDMLVKGEGVQANNIFFGSTISNDGFAGETFDFMLSNPPFGTPWKTDLKAWGDIKKDEITDTRFRVNYLIHGYQKQIKLLKERRQTIIDRSTTQGINENAEEVAEDAE